MPLKNLLSAFCATHLLLACSIEAPNKEMVDQSQPSTEDAVPDVSDRPTPQMVPQKPRRLLFSGVKPKAMPWKSRVITLDIEAMTLRELLSGESGDLDFFRIGSEILMVNRTFDSRNLRRFRDGEFSVQTKLELPSAGDPHDAKLIGPNLVALALYNSKKLALMRPSSGKLVQLVDADWDVPKGLRPESLILVEKKGQRFLYVVHQGSTLEDGKMKLDGSQAVFVLKIEGIRLIPVDLNPNKPRLQGLPLVGAFPVAILGKNEVILASLCNSFLNLQESCQNLVEKLDPIGNTVETLWDLNSLGYSMNGMIRGYGSGFLAATFRAKEKKLELVHFDLAKKEAKPVYEYQSMGFWGYFYDASRSELWIGDQKGDYEGQLTRVSKGGERQVIPLPYAPFSGVFD